MTDAERVLRVISYAPKPIADICTASGLPRRSVEEAINALRLEGRPIASGSRESARGVWLARSADELATSNATLRGRLVSQYRTLKAQQRAERRLRMRAERYEQPGLLG